MKRVILLNGPPNSGKDTIADIMVDKIGAKHLMFKSKLYVDTAKYLEQPLQDLMFVCSDRLLKEQPSIPLNDRIVTPREALIYVAEEVIKPRKGSDYYQEYIAELLEDGLTVISDSGFDDDVEVMSQEADDVLLIRLYRKGCSFKTDSRGYILEADPCLYPNVTYIDYTVIEDDPDKILDSVYQFVLK